MATKTDVRLSAVDKYFMITERGSNYSREIRGGFATFFAMSYIVVLNPLILGGADSTGDEFWAWNALPPSRHLWPVS